MSENILAYFENIKLCVFDIDGVLTDGSIHVTTQGEQLRTFNIKDGFAIVKAIELGLPIAVISAGKNEGARKRMEFLGLTDIYIDVKNKLEILETLLQTYNCNLNQVLYMGDDLLDAQVLKVVGLPTCPADAANDIFALCKYVSPKEGGKGAVRDVLEKVLKAQGKWPQI